MAAGNGKGGTNLVIKDANTNTVIGNGDIQAEICFVYLKCLITFRTSKFN